jgi:hypothetical protein
MVLDVKDQRQKADKRGERERREEERTKLTN